MKKIQDPDPADKTDSRDPAAIAKRLRLEVEIKKADENRSPLSLIFLDLDQFKGVNDQHGHLVGSQTLKEVGFVLRDAVNLETAIMPRLEANFASRDTSLAAEKLGKAVRMARLARNMTRVDFAERARISAPTPPSKRNSSGQPFFLGSSLLHSISTLGRENTCRM